MSDIRVAETCNVDREQSGRTVAAVLVITGVFMLWWTWGTWPDPWVDFGRELYTPWMLTRGKVLYRDIAWFNGPLSAYVNAMWFRIAGVSLRSLVLLNLAILAGLVALIFVLFRSMATRLATAVVTAIFLSVFAFGEYADVGNYNYLTPYSHELVHGIALSFIALWGLIRWLTAQRTRYSIVVGLAVGLTFLTKPEIFVALVVAIASGLFLAWRGSLVRARGQLTGIAAGTLPIAAAVALLSGAMPITVAAKSVMAPYLFVSSSQVRSLTFYREMTGLAAAGHSVRILLGMAALLGVALGAAAVAAFRASRYRAEVVAFSGLTLLAIALPGGRFITENIALPLPLFVTGVLMLLLNAMHLEFNRSGLVAQPDVVKATMLVFSLMLLLKVLLRVHISRYGFVLAMPATLTAIICLIDWIPHMLDRRGADGELFRRLSLCGVAVVTMVFLATHQSRIAAERYRVGNGADGFLADERGVPLQRLVNEVRDRLGPDDRLVMIPEGVMVNYLTRIQSSSEFVTFMPPEAAMFGGDRLVRSLQENPPEYVAVVQRPIEEYGYRRFGQDFAPGMATWIQARYRAELSIPGVGERGMFGVQLLRRTHPAAGNP
jgi:hypothetical protein